MRTQTNTMNNKDQFPTNQLIQNTISAFRNGYIGEDQVTFSLDFASKLGDKSAQELLDKCKELGVAKALEEIGR